LACAWDERPIWPHSACTGRVLLWNTCSRNRGEPDHKKQLYPIDEHGHAPT